MFGFSIVIEINECVKSPRKFGLADHHAKKLGNRGTREVGTKETL
jgi:hypothetical protein